MYGMCVQRPVKQIIEEDYITGDFSIRQEEDEEALYQKYVESPRSVLPYQWGVWVTSYAFARLFRIGSCCRDWIYSDTDSCYGRDWDKKALAAYNRECKKALLDRGYGPVRKGSRDFWLGVALLDGSYSEFVTVGAKRYACRQYYAGKLKITVAGVPKSGAKCLQNDITNFRAGFVFDGRTTGKLLHTYFYEDDISIDAYGNERGDSIDLSPDSYTLDSITCPNWEKLFEEDISIKVYDENEIL